MTAKTRSKTDMRLNKNALPPIIAASAFVAVALGINRFGADPAADATPPGSPAAAAPTELSAAPPAVEPSLGPTAAEFGSPSVANPEAAAERERLEALLAERDATIAARDAEITRLGGALAARDETVAALEARLAAIETELAARVGEVDALKAQLGVARLQPPPFDVAKFLPSPDEPVPAAIRDPRAFGLEAPETWGNGTRPAPRPARARAPAAQEAGAAALPFAEVHFERASATLTPGGRERGLEAAALILTMPPSPIRLTGHADRTGPAAVNERLSRARAEAVANLLVSAGLPRDRIEVMAYGADEGRLPVQTAAGVAEPLNRCVGIWIGDAPGTQG
jgi:outer membrane protein OmpA-like peptidoglycan-associated protein